MTDDRNLRSYDYLWNPYIWWGNNALLTKKKVVHEFFKTLILEKFSNEMTKDCK